MDERRGEQGGFTPAFAKGLGGPLSHRAEIVRHGADLRGEGLGCPHDRNEAMVGTGCDSTGAEFCREKNAAVVFRANQPVADFPVFELSQERPAAGGVKG